MIELAIQKYFRNGGTEEELLAKYAITSKPHPRYPNLRMHKYSQLESPFAEEIVQDCRGIILDKNDNYRVVNLSMRKFFNHGEICAAEIDWTTAKCLEKVDGSLIQVYWYNNEWHVASSGTPDAGGEVNGFGITFAGYFWEAFVATGQRIAQLPTTCCFFFELSGPMNRIVVQHSRVHLALLGARDLTTLRELTLDEAAAYVPNVPRVREYQLQSIADVVATLADMKPLEQEGYVICDSAFRRIKVKCPAYVTLHYAKDCMSRRAIVEIVRQGESSEVESAFPELGDLIKETRERYNALVYRLELDYAELKDIPVQKDFALQAVARRCPGGLFAVRAKKHPTFKNYLKDIHLDSVISLLGYSSAETMPGKPVNPQ